MSATGGIGCLIVQDSGTRYLWEGIMEDTLRRHCHRIARCKAQYEEALSAFAEMNRQGMDVVCVGIGKGTIQAASIASRLSCAGMIVLGSPFASGLRGVFCNPEEKRTLRQLFAMVCPALIVHPMGDARMDATSGERLVNALTGTKEIETCFLSDATMETLWESRENVLNNAFNSFFAAVSCENHLRK